MRELRKRSMARAPPWKAPQEVGERRGDVGEVEVLRQVVAEELPQSDGDQKQEFPDGRVSIEEGPGKQRAVFEKQQDPEIHRDPESGIERPALGVPKDHVVTREDVDRHGGEQQQQQHGLVVGVEDHAGCDKDRHLETRRTRRVVDRERDGHQEEEG
jgi:hypothetical protein